MTDPILTNLITSINENYPVSGQDNSTQGFRDNFANIKDSLSYIDDNVLSLVNPGGSELCASAIAATGEIYRTEPIASPQLYSIRDYDGFLESAGGGTWDIILKRIPFPVPVQLTVRAVGRNGIDNTLPQVDGTWTVTPVVNDPYRFTLVGSVYGAMNTDSGVAYVPNTLVDAHTELEAMAVWLRANGGGCVSMPPSAGIYLKSGPFRLIENSIYECNNCFTFKADSIDQPSLFNSSISTGRTSTLANVSDLLVRNLWIYDNRGYQIYYAGQHAVNIGTDNAPQKIQQWIEFDRVHVRGSSGYGGSSANNNGMINFIKKNGSVKWSDGDSWDRKNPLSRNDQITFENESHYWPALGDIGTNLKAVRGVTTPFRVASLASNIVRITWKNHGWQTGNTVLITGQTVGNGVTIPTTALAITIIDVNTFSIVGTGSSTATTSWGNPDVKILRCMATNSIITYIGEKYFDIPRTTDVLSRIGEKATIEGAGTVNGINIDGSWDVTDVVLIGVIQYLRHARMDPVTGLATGTAASASGSGGGSTATYNCPHISEGDRVIDSRSLRSTIRTLRVSGEFYGRAGLQQRGGEAAQGQEGGHFLSVSDYRFNDLTPAWVGLTRGGGSALALAGRGAIVRDVHIVAPGCRIGIALGTLTTDALVSDFIIDGPQTGIAMRGNRNRISSGRVKNSSAYGLSIWGYLSGIWGDLPDDPFTPVEIGGGRVIVNAPGHGVANITVGNISNITQTNPVVLTTSSPHGFSPLYNLVGIRGVLGMTEINGRVLKYTILNTTQLELAVDGTGFSAYTGSGFLVNRKVLLTGQSNGSGLVILGSNRADYIAMYIDANSFYIDCGEEIIGAGSSANATTPFGGDRVRVYYGAVPATSTENVFEGIEFTTDDGFNTAVAISHGGGEGILSVDQGRAADNVFRNCKQTGYATPFEDFDETGNMGPTGISSAHYSGNIGIYNQLPIITIGPTAGTTNPTVLTSDDIGETFCVPSTATEQGMFTLPAPTVELIGTEYSFVSLHATLGVKINANGAGIRILAVSAGISSSVSTTDVGATLTLKLISVTQWVATASVGTWVTP